MPRTGAEIAATAVLALALIGGGAFAVIRMRKQ
ncbi:LPXTG cell wall anchor domain-containing protein [Dermabacter hominis]|nr:LPXTG cell wall anchor domain-containing protein [Dermabacter hominis]